ncbi:MAG: hypothetical protein U0491_01620 [Candidatus Saccharimonadales bacterium]
MNIITLPVLFAVISLLIALNPVTIAIFTALLAGGYGKKSSKSHIHATALAYLLVLAALFIVSGFLWMNFLDQISLFALERIAIIVGLVCIVWGTFSLKDYFWYSERTRAPKFIARSVHKRTIKKHEPFSAGVLAITTAYAIAPSMGLPVLGLLTSAVLLGVVSVRVPVVITLVLITPLVAIFVLSLRKMRLSAIMVWRQDSRMVFRLTIGLTTVFIGWLIMLILNGTLGANL